MKTETKNSNTSQSQISPIILLVDDNTRNLQVLGKLLQDENYKIEFAVNGESALEWLRIKQFDLVLLDLNMPGLNGFEVCKIIRANKKTREIPIIFLSAESERESILKGFEVGAQDYLTKPFDSRELLARVKTQIDLKSKTEKLEKVNEWLGKKIDNWLKYSINKPQESITDNIASKLLEYDKSHNAALRGVFLELFTSLKEIEKLITSLKDKEMQDKFEEILGKMEESVKKIQEI